jgi:hypothetical protein
MNIFIEQSSISTDVEPISSTVDQTSIGLLEGLSIFTLLSVTKKMNIFLEESSISTNIEPISSTIGQTSVGLLKGLTIFTLSRMTN